MPAVDEELQLGRIGQNERRSSLQAVLNDLEILKLAGLVEW